MSIDISIACFLGSLGQKCWSLLSSSLQGTVLELINKPLLQRGNVSLGESRVFTLTEAIVFKECFRGRFQGLRAHISTETPSTASDRESAVMNSINMATSKLVCFRSFNEESVSAYLLSPVLGKKASLLTHASQQRQGVFDFVLARFQQSESRTKTFFTYMTNTCR